MAIPKQVLTEADMRTLRAFRDAIPPARVNTSDRTYMRLFGKGMVVGAVGKDERGEPIGIVKLTRRGQTALAEAEAA